MATVNRRRKPRVQDVRHLAYIAADIYRDLYGDDALARAREAEALLRRRGYVRDADIVLAVVLAIGATQMNMTTSVN